MRLVVSNSRNWTPLPGSKGSSSTSKTSSFSPSPTSSRSLARSKISPDVKRLVRQMAAELLAIGRVRPNIVALEAQAVDEVFRLVFHQEPVALPLPFDDAPAPPVAPRRRRQAGLTLFAVAQFLAVAL